MDLVRFKNKESSVGIMIPAITEVLKDGKFWTRALSLGNDQFGRNPASEYFTTSIDNVNKRNQRLIHPKTDYEMFEITTNPLEADLIAISYCMGTDFKDVEKSLGGNKFIVKEKLQVKTRIPTKSIEEFKKNNNEDKFEPYHDNGILKYRGLAHHDKRIDEVGYEGDCNTEIELHEDCNFKMYKLIGVRKIES